MGDVPMRIHDFGKRIDTLRALGFSVGIPPINGQVIVERLDASGRAVWSAWINDGPDLLTRAIGAWVDDGSPGVGRINVDLNVDETGVVHEVVKGLQTGRTVYGPLNIEDNGRDWLLEALEECRDLAVYLSAQVIRVKRARDSR